MDNIERSNRAEPLWVGRQPREIRVHSGDDGSVVYFVPEGEVESLRQQHRGAVSDAEHGRALVDRMFELPRGPEWEQALAELRVWSMTRP
jgi:hypothetical protein